MPRSTKLKSYHEVRIAIATRYKGREKDRSWKLEADALSVDVVRLEAEITRLRNENSDLVRVVLQLRSEGGSPVTEIGAQAKLALIRSIVVSAGIEAGENLSPGASAAIAWRVIGQLQKVLSRDENNGPNLVMTGLAQQQDHT